jgi:DNA-binding response OmpR family regulator
MIYRVGTYTIDSERCELRNGAEAVAVEPQVFDVLMLLIAHRERVVTKDELIERVWRGRIVAPRSRSTTGRGRHRRCPAWASCGPTSTTTRRWGTSAARSR